MNNKSKLQWQNIFLTLILFASHIVSADPAVKNDDLNQANKILLENKKELLKLLRETSSKERIAVINTIGDLKLNEALPDLLKILSEDLDVGVRLAAVNAVGKLELNELAIKSVESVLADKNAYVVRSAASVLSKKGYKSGIEALIKLLDTPDDDFVFETIQILEHFTKHSFGNPYDSSKEGSTKEDMPTINPKQLKIVVEEWKKWWSQDKEVFKFNN
jgi:HEAT repeat protein